jgi:hypothetical protein
VISHLVRIAVDLNHLPRHHRACPGDSHSTHGARTIEVAGTAQPRPGREAVLKSDRIRL